MGVVTTAHALACYRAAMVLPVTVAVAALIMLAVVPMLAVMASVVYEPMLTDSSDA
jgi:hypothetical protein